MNLFPSFAAFIVVTAITYPLYEGAIAIAVSVIAGILTAVFVALGKQQQMKQLTSEQYKLVQALEKSTEMAVKSLEGYQEKLENTVSDLAKQTTSEHQKLVGVTEQSTDTIVKGLQTYQNQLTKTVSDLAKQTNDSLMVVWKNTQQQLLTENKEMKETTTKLVTEISLLQQQQKQLADETGAGLQQWLVEQKQVSQETFSAVQDSHKSLLENANTANDKIEQLWRIHHEEELLIRQQEQQAFNAMLAALEAKEVAYSNHLDEQREIFEAAQKQLKDTLKQQAQLSHNNLLTAWKEIAEQQLALRQQEHTHIMVTQKTVTALIDQNTAALSEKIIDGWNVTRKSLETLRKAENEHSVALLQTVEQTNEKMLDTLNQQQQTFDTAQSFYGNTYEQIKTYTGELNNHEHALSVYHQQLIDTQVSIKETIAKTLHDTLTQYTDVLSASKETIASSIEELKEQRAVSEETFGGFLEAFLEGTEKQEQEIKNLVNHLKTEVDNLLENSSTQLERAITQMTRSGESQSESVKKIVIGSKEVLERNQQVLLSLQAQTEETKATAKLLERAFKEVTALNKNDMDILQRLMR
ncbi:hypothetical protein [Exiguobacterium sp. S22-S28]|uniref:hypothetical protein n=1 Tax=Exiguobacterium sp. S22-S28 TaxID=3342768 RepID=UPI00372D283B